MQFQEIWEKYTAQTLESMLEDSDDLDSLSSWHNAMFDKAMDVGVEKSQITRKMDDINYQLARKHMLELRDAIFITRKSMEQFDRPIACDIMRCQIMGIGQLVQIHLETLDEAGGDGSGSESTDSTP